MKRTILVLGITFVCLFSPACLFSSGPVKGSVAGVEVIVESLKRMKEYNVPGSSEFGPIRPLRAAQEKEFVIIELRVPKKITLGSQGRKVEEITSEWVTKQAAKVKDDKGLTYESIYSEVLEFNDQNVEAKILFELPQHTALSTFMLGETSFDLSKVKNE